jgi:hypothetical protein
MGATVRAAAIRASPGQWDDEGESSECLSVMAVTAAPGPSVMMTTASAPPVVVTAPAAAHVSVAMPVAAPDLDQGAVHRRRGRYAQPGGSGYGHGQRSKQRSSNQNETSHLVSLPSRHRDQAQVPDEWVCSPGPKLNPSCDIRASIAVYSRLCAWRCSPRRRQRDAESVWRVARDGVGDATWRLRSSPLSRFTPAACGRRPGLRRFRRSQRESVSRRAGLRRRGRWQIGGHRARRHDGRQAGVDHDPLRPPVTRLNADAAVNIGAGRLERELRHVPVRHEQQRQQCAAYKDEIPTEGHAHHRCFDPQKPASTETTRNGSGESGMGSDTGACVLVHKSGKSGNTLHDRWAGEQDG